MVATSAGPAAGDLRPDQRDHDHYARCCFAVNLALVLYLVITKRLFGVRGGKAAYDARLRSESIMEAAARAAAGRAPATATATP